MSEGQKETESLMALTLSTTEIVHLYFALLIVVTILNLLIGRFTYDVLILTVVIIPMLFLTWWDVRQAKIIGAEALLKGFSQNIIIIFLLFIAVTAISSAYYNVSGRQNPNDLRDVADFYHNIFSTLPFTMDNLLKDVIVSIASSLVGGLVTKTIFKGGSFEFGVG